MTYPNQPGNNSGGRNNRPNPFNPFGDNSNKPRNNGGPNGNNNAPRSFWQRPWLYIVLIVLILFFIFQAFLGNNTQTINTQDGMNILNSQASDVESATIVDNTQQVQLKLKNDFKKNDPQTGRERNYGKDVQFYYTTAQQAQVVRAVEKANPSQGWTATMHSTSMWTYLLSSVVPFLIFFALIWFLMSRMSSSAGGMLGMGGKKSAKLADGQIPKTKFSDVAGEEAAVQEVEEIKDFLKDPAKYKALGARIPRGVLLYGPPGTGKTLLARAIAGEAGVPFYAMAGSDFVEMFVGLGASRVRDLFDEAKKNAPAIIFIDEIDAVGRKRGSGMGGGHDEREQTLNQLLVEMDGFGSNDGVIVMAATNRRDILDPALLRPGRFDRQIYVNVPDVGGREAILRVHARDKQLSDDVDLRTVARATAGFTGADLENLLNEAALISARKNLPVITMQTMEDAVLKVIAGPEKRSLVNIERDRRITAIHEAGHAVAAYFLPTQEPVHQITIVPRGNALGLTISLPDQDTLHTTRNEMRDRIVVLLGGRVAEQLEFDDISTGASNDLQRATKLAHDMIAKYGMNERIGAVAYDDDSEIFVGRDYERTRSYSEQTAAEIDAEVRKTVDQAYAHCTQILTEHHEKLQEIAQWLLEHETMSWSPWAIRCSTTACTPLTTRPSLPMCRRACWPERRRPMEPKKIKNPTGMLIMHGTVIAVVLYMAWQLVRSYRAGGAEAPSLTTLIVGLVLLVGGCVVVGWLAVRLFLQAKREEKALEQETEQLHAAAAQENLKAPENSEE